MLVPDAERRLGPAARLFAPGERLGWVFRDRSRQWRPFGEPPPRPVVPDPRLLHRLDRLRVSLRAGLVQGPAALAAVLVLWLVFGRSLPGAAVAVLIALAALAVLRFAVPGVRLLLVRRRLMRDGVEAGRRTDAAMRAWRAREEEHRRREWERVDRIPEWGAARLGPEVGRIDIFGGSLWSWQAFLTLAGSSMVRGSAPVTVVDLSREVVCGELAELAAAAGFLVDLQVLPRDQAGSDLLEGLAGPDLTEVLVESVRLLEGGSGSSPAVDARVLGSLCEALGASLTLGRLEEALRVLMGEPPGPDRTEQLTKEEREHIAAGLFSPEYVRQARRRLGVLEAHLHAIRELGIHPGSRPRDAQLRCVAVEGGGPAADLLAQLAGQWALRSVSDASVAPRTLVVAGADRLDRRLLERLGDACERRQIRLLYLFQHLREQAFEVSGSRATIFLRLGQPEEADRAAGLIGRGHRFVLSQITKSQGGREASAGSEQDGLAAGGSSAVLRLDSTRTWSRSWGSSESYATATNWHYAETSQRVHEYLVEPRTLMDLPEYGMLIVRSTPQGPRVLAADCDPDRVYLPRLTTDPLPDTPGATPTPLPDEGRRVEAGSKPPRPT